MTPEAAKTVMDFVAGTIEREQATTRRVVAAVPVGQEEYTPDEKSMKALDLAWHTVSSEVFFMEGCCAGCFEGGGKRPDEVNTGAAVAAWYAEAGAKAVAKLKEMTPEQCAAVLNFHDVFKQPAFGFAQLALTHSIHHRGQLSAYLRPMGAKVPSIYGPSGDVSLDDLTKGASQGA